jgi:hypothetical protein
VKFRCVKPNGYRGAVTATFGQEIEVEEGLAAELLALPDWFEAVGGQDSPAAEVESAEPKTKSLPAPPRSKPYKAKGKGK